MKRFLLLIAVISAISPVFAANDISQLSIESQQEYLMNALSIETSVETISNVSAIANPLGNGSIATGISRGSSSTEWYPYLGPNEIDKGTFYKLTGQIDLYNEYEKGMKKEKNMHIAGWTMFSVGLAAYLGLFIGSWAIPDKYVGDIVRCTSFGFLGLTLAAIPLNIWTYKDNVSISFAIGVSNVYNNRLYESLK